MSIRQTDKLPQVSEFVGRETIEVGSNVPILLNDPQTLWFIVSGSVDVFFVPMKDGKVAGARSHLFRARAGEILLGFEIASRGDNVSIIAVGSRNTTVSKILRQDFEDLLRSNTPQSSIRLLNRWIERLSFSLVHVTTMRRVLVLPRNEQVILQADEMARTNRGVLWVKVVDGLAQFMSNPELPMFAEDDSLPITAESWVYTPSGVTVKTLDTATFLKENFRWLYLENFHRIVLDSAIWQMQNIEDIDYERLLQRQEYDSNRLKRSYQQLSGILRGDSQVDYATQYSLDDPLLAACKIVGDSLGIDIHAPTDAVDGREEDLTLDSIIHASRIHIREVGLRGDWWKQDNGALLGFTEDEEHPVALIPVSANRYEIVDTIQKTRQPLTANEVKKLSNFAYSFYRTLPNKALSARDIVNFGLKNTRSDLLLFAFMGIFAGLLAITTPLVIQRIFDDVIPGADQSQLMQLSLLLLAIAISVSLFNVVRNIAVMRLEMKFEGSVQSAIWDRLMNLPPPFFRNYTAGDLTSRAMGVSTIRRHISGTVAVSIIGSIFSIFNFFLLFYFDLQLALVAFVLVVGAVIVTFLSGYTQMKHRRELADVRGAISGMVLQFITGVSKLRVAGVEHRAFSEWANRFAVQKHSAYKAGNIENVLEVFNATYPIASAMIIFAMTARSQTLTTGEFLAFNAAFTQFLFAGLELSSASIDVLKVLPLWERMKPILQMVPEVDDTKSDPGELQGGIEVSKVSFQYKTDSPMVLKDVSFQVEAGDFVALVGPSGSGKSTLLRILLGFEKPLSGTVFYDQQDLSGLDIRSVRRQLGVVLQNSQLMTGNVYSNIAGVAQLTLEEAWEAAQMAGLEEDIQAMPMQMHTVVSEGGSTLSGGQRQRLLIARAVAKKPKILFFDEATSALDNRTQAIVSKSLESLDATRIVIAHRLSTIMHADKIIVFENGEIVQQGTYEELIQEKGVFATLAKRQLV